MPHNSVNTHLGRNSSTTILVYLLGKNVRPTHQSNQVSRHISSCKEFHICNPSIEIHHFHRHNLECHRRIDYDCSNIDHRHIGKCNLVWLEGTVVCHWKSNQLRHFHQSIVQIRHILLADKKIRAHFGKPVFLSILMEKNRLKSNTFWA